MLSEGYKTDRDGGAITPVRLLKDRSLVVIDGHARYQEMVRQGGVYTLATAVAGVTVAAANVFSAANPQPLVGIANPAGSGVNAVILKAQHVWASGTAAAGGLVWAVCNAVNGAAMTATGVTTSSLNNLTFLASSVMKQFVNSALTGATMSAFRYAGGPTTGALAANGNQSFIDYVDGEIIVPPGCILGLFAAAAGTSPIIAASMSYEEVAV